MTWGFVGAAAITVVGGAIASNQSKKGAQAATNAQLQGIDEQRRQFDLMRQDQMPWLQAGQWALPKLQETYDGNFTGFLNSPDYLATQEQGLSFMDRSAASRGGLYSGGHSADLMKYGGNLAAQQLGNYRGGLAGLAGVGQNSAQSIGAAGMGMASNISNAYGNIGNTRQSAYDNQAGGIAATANGLAGLYGQYMGQRSTQQGGGWGGSGMYYNAPSTASGANWTNAYGYHS